MKHIFSRKFVKLSGFVISGLVASAAIAADPVPPVAPPVTAPMTSPVAAPPMSTSPVTAPPVTAPLATPGTAMAAQPNADAAAQAKANQDVHMSPRVEVFAFTPVNKAEPSEWIGRGIQENLQSDISKTGATLVLPPHQAVATDDPMDAARRDHADLAIVGTYQVVGDQVRVNAHMVDVTSNTPAGGFSATGAQHDLFQIEDALGEQLRRLLPRPSVAAQPNQPAPLPLPEQQIPAVTYSQPAPTIVYQESPQTIYTPPAYYGNSANYYPEYGYGGYGYDGFYGYPFGFYGGIGIYGGGYRGGYSGGYRNNGGRGFGGTVGGGVHVGTGVGRVGGGGGFHGGGGGGHR